MVVGMQFDESIPIKNEGTLKDILKKHDVLFKAPSKLL